MAFIEGEDINVIKLVLTNYGKKRFLESGLLPQFKYYSLIDKNLIYNANVEPDKLPALNGSNDSGTEYKNNTKHTVTK
jgi:hypothetical protein